MDRALLPFVLGSALTVAAAACSSFSEPDDGPRDLPSEAGSDAFAAPDGASDDGNTDDARKPRSDAGGACNHEPDCERVVFLTSMQFYTYELGGVMGAHERCNDAAKTSQNKRVNGRTFLAWLSDGTTSPSAFMAKGTAQYVLPSGAKIADSWTDLTDQTLDAVIDEDEHGAKTTSSVVWTGTLATGAAAPNHCLAWQEQDAGATANVGSSTETSAGQWTNRASPDTCDTDHRIYCFED